MKERRELGVDLATAPVRGTDMGSSRALGFNGEQLRVYSTRSKCAGVRARGSMAVPDSLASPSRSRLPTPQADKGLFPSCWVRPSQPPQHRLWPDRAGRDGDGAGRLRCGQAKSNQGDLSFSPTTESQRHTTKTATRAHHPRPQPRRPLLPDSRALSRPRSLVGSESRGSLVMHYLGSWPLTPAENRLADGPREMRGEARACMQ